MRALPNELRRQLESAVLAGRHAAEAGVRAALRTLAVADERKPDYLTDEQARLRRGLRAKQRQLGSDLELLVWECAYEQWHRLLFARFLAENGLLRHPRFGAPVTLEECEELAEELGEPDGWSVAARFAAEILPGIFRLDDPCVQLRLAAEHRVALERVLADLPGEVFLADDSLGWVYQYWQSERKDEVNRSEVKIGGADLGPVTQLFTENYMVRFLLENSLGAWWAARHPESPLVKDFEFLRFDDEGRPAAGRFHGWPDRVAEVTVMDPCCGSGHFLVEAFGMLWRMRAEEEALDPVAAQDAVLRDNLFGLELDPRCVQIAMFAVSLTAWKQGGGWRELPPTNIGCSGIAVKTPQEEWTALGRGDQRLERALTRLHALFKDADTLGSLINPRSVGQLTAKSKAQPALTEVDFAEIAALLTAAGEGVVSDPGSAVLGVQAAGIARAASLLSASYTLIATNVPYLQGIKQVEAIAEYCSRELPPGNSDLATAFILRLRAMALPGGAFAYVAPQSWLSLGTYQLFRRELLKTQTFRMLARLGTGAFAAITGSVVNVVLGISSNFRPDEDAIYVALDCQEARGPQLKAAALAATPAIQMNQWSQLRQPSARILTSAGESKVLLGNHVDTYQGICLGDSSRFRQAFWEGPISAGWVLQQNSVKEDVLYGGREFKMLWEKGAGRFISYVTERLGEDRVGTWVRGLDAWGRNGIAVSNTGEMRSTVYSGSPFQHNLAVLIPKSEVDLPAVWCFVTSPVFKRAIRQIDTALKVENTVFRDVPFDIDEWRQEAEKEFPHGLPEPVSDDPTQWLFEGRPEVSTEPSQVGVGRLAGYRWPGQADCDDLERFADEDGTVCLPAVGGELPAADRLTALLSAAFAEGWSPSLMRQLLERTGSRKKSLSDWLRDDFFAHHCKVFSHRPFVWHIGDGRKDGFSALVNYHRLDRSGLEKLTYTYLGDWIERQRADAAEDVAGADLRLAAARELKGKLEAILEGEPPYDIFVRWKELHEQPIGWDPDLDDGVRLNIRPFVEAGVLRTKVNVHWKKDRGRNPDGSERHNDLHYTRAEKLEARRKVRDR